MSTRLGEFLVRRGHITSDQLVDATNYQQQHGGAITGALVHLGCITESDLTSHLHREYRLPIVDPASLELSPALLGLIPGTLAHKHGMLPVGRDGSTLTIAMADPSNLMGINEAKFLTGCDIRVVLAGPQAIEKALAKYYNQSADAYERAIGDLNTGDVEVIRDVDAVDLNELQRATEEAPLVKLVNAILTDAVEKRASDIHIEPYETDLRVRFRIDGMLHDVLEPPTRFKNALASRIKIMAALDIAERRLPQDGAIQLRLGSGQDIDIRVSVLPTVYGEKIVLRLLYKSNLQLGMAQLGFDSKGLQAFQKAIEDPYGMILVTGPTGSGKSTTLYSALSEINKSYRNISTAEDPVELKVRGINQVQVVESIGLSFAAALRSFLRQDPDVIMVGEIRDGETAEIAIKAALTGHLVLSTLHTNDAPSAVNRLLNMGVEPFLVTSSLTLIMAQRLVRTICPHCRHEVVDVPEEALLDIGFSEEDIPGLTVFEGRGCDECAETGYHGRQALFEVFSITDDIREMVLRHASANEIKKLARQNGMRTLREDGLERVRTGVTSIGEILRVTVSD